MEAKNWGTSYLQLHTSSEQTDANSVPNWMSARLAVPKLLMDPSPRVHTQNTSRMSGQALFLLKIEVHAFPESSEAWAHEDACGCSCRAQPQTTNGYQAGFVCAAAGCGGGGRELQQEGFQASRAAKGIRENATLVSSVHSVIHDKVRTFSGVSARPLAPLMLAGFGPFLWVIAPCIIGRNWKYLESDKTQSGVMYSAAIPFSLFAYTTFAHTVTRQFVSLLPEVTCTGMKE